MRKKPDELCGNFQNNEYDHYLHGDLDSPSRTLPLQQRDDGVSDRATAIMRMRIIEKMLFYFLWAIQRCLCKVIFFYKARV